LAIEFKAKLEGVWEKVKAAMPVDTVILASADLADA
jgi:hypothetical protein